ncbi:hypothetical protein [Staphylococcus aureus]|uniref:hypothetical protein n=1 Tax=Staphylococcus aureus TaxID=1280 RepID=UPI0020BE49C8|nr:hypothetical protein [Staphylococcus aureus]
MFDIKTKFLADIRESLAAMEQLEHLTEDDEGFYNSLVMMHNDLVDEVEPEGERTR